MTRGRGRGTIGTELVSGENGSRGGSTPRRWEAVLPREEIARLLAERRWSDLLARLREARARWPRDLELIRSVRVLEDHLETHPERRE